MYSYQEETVSFADDPSVTQLQHEAAKE